MSRKPVPSLRAQAELNKLGSDIAIARARQLAAGGLREIGDYLNRKYGKSVAFGA